MRNVIMFYVYGLSDPHIAKTTQKGVVLENSTVTRTPKIVPLRFHFGAINYVPLATPSSE